VEYGGGDGSYDDTDITWTFDEIPPDGGTATGWFWVVLPCDGTVTNDVYVVISSDQGVTSDLGPEVSFEVMPPTIELGIDYSPLLIMAGDTVNFTGTFTSDGSTDPISYTWAFGDGGFADSLVASHKYTEDDSYTVTFTATDVCNYYSMIQTSLDVIPPTINASFDQSATTIVVSDTVSFTDTSTTNGPDITSWEWDFGDGTAKVFTQDSNHTFLGGGLFDITLVVTDELGYSDSVSNTVNVGPPELEANFDQSSTTVLIGETVYYTDTSTTDVGEIVAWEWYFGDGSPHVFTQDASHAFSSDGDFEVTLVVTDTFGFSDDFSRTTHVDVPCVPLTEVSYNFIPGKPFKNEVITFTATITPSNATTPVEYVWDFDDGTVITVTQVVVTHTYLSGSTYDVVVTASNTCTVGVYYELPVMVAETRIFLPLILR
jgi:PKD repeat protein